MHWKRFDNKVVVAAAVGAVADIRISLPHRSSQKENITANWWARFSYDALLLWAAPSPPPFSPCGGGGIVIRKLFRDFFFFSSFYGRASEYVRKKNRPPPSKIPLSVDRPGGVRRLGYRRRRQIVSAVLIPAIQYV